MGDTHGNRPNPSNFLSRTSKLAEIAKREREGVMVAEFRGSPPHDLGIAELATVRPLDANIEVTLHILDDWHRPIREVVRVKMAPSVALSFAKRLITVAGAEANSHDARLL
jgi:hypothetical protein